MGWCFGFLFVELDLFESLFEILPFVKMGKWFKAFGAFQNIRHLSAKTCMYVCMYLCRYTVFNHNYILETV